ncbi:MAG: hypothetical protein IJH63_00815 [Methanobrevibacter sp.]|nr:hypothetical protein [Methanosphaera sp.]MBR0369246.1 hypothetical protein [Methanobrevibacter sp.]
MTEKTQEDTMTNTVNYERVAKKLEKQVNICADESARRHRIIMRLEKRNDELNKTIPHQNVLLSAYKDVVFNYQSRLRKYEEKFGDVE